MDALEVFEMFFGPSEGYINTLIDSQDEKGSWRLDCCYDERCIPAKFWLYQFWSGSSFAKECMSLKTSEVRGYLKAKHPKFDSEKAIKEKVAGKLQKLIGELE